ncbi:MAG: quinone-dependent dihydroorotate dehydrogenase [Candidatus Levyibacteriota bacterium]
MYNKTATFLSSTTYKYFFKPVAFSMDPETVHVHIVSLGEWIGKHRSLRKAVSLALVRRRKSLEQEILGMKFKSPIGLSAGFDYEARLTQISPCVGFGFQSVGTITNRPYEGNHKPRLGRLPKSKSLMVNKGFKNPGAATIAKKLHSLTFRIPIGISVGRTNTTELDQEESVKDVIAAFRTLENSKLKTAYYELNISCPNLYGTVDFYNPKKLDDVLEAVDKLKIKKPIFVKMPITQTDKETLDMLKVIDKHCPAGIIFGNLQNKSGQGLKKEELRKWKTGNFSGKPTFQRSNELIELAYKQYKDRFVIIGTGGVFSAKDAYLKIKKGASLVQLITGMIFEGPQLISQINAGLEKLLKKEGYKHLSEAIGKDVSM